MLEFVKKLLGGSNDSALKKLEKTVRAVEALEDTYKRMTDDELRAKTQELKARLSHGETEDDILPDAFALVREADDRVLGMRPYRVQILGGIVLHQGRIAEMKTGEGKTLVATLPAFLNALSGKGLAHIGVVDGKDAGLIFRKSDLCKDLSVFIFPFDAVGESDIIAHIFLSLQELFIIDRTAPADKFRTAAGTDDRCLSDLFEGNTKGNDHRADMHPDQGSADINAG